MKTEFTYIEKYLKTDGGVNEDGSPRERYKNGIDVGPGTNRLSPDIISIDEQKNTRFAHAQLVHDCKDLNIFADGVLDFIFSSHVLEDFEDIPAVFLNWWGKLKADGLMILLLPDMEGGRYAKIDEKDASGKLKGNPSHRTNVGKEYINDMLDALTVAGKIDYEMVQEDTIPHKSCSTIDFVIRKKK